MFRQAVVIPEGIIAQEQAFASGRIDLLVDEHGGSGTFQCLAKVFLHIYKGQIARLHLVDLIDAGDEVVRSGNVVEIAAQADRAGNGGPSVPEHGFVTIRRTDDHGCPIPREHHAVAETGRNHSGRIRRLHVRHLPPGTVAERE